MSIRVLHRKHVGGVYPHTSENVEYVWMEVPPYVRETEETSRGRRVRAVIGLLVCATVLTLAAAAAVVAAGSPPIA